MSLGKIIGHKGAGYITKDIFFPISMVKKMKFVLTALNFRYQPNLPYDQTRKI